MRLWKIALAGVSVSVLASSAWGHTSYIRPNVFSTSSADMVTAQSAFTEDFFAPEIAVRSADYHVILPDGSRSDFDTHMAFKQVVQLEEALVTDGTYLLTTGQRAGRKSKMMRVSDGWEALKREGADGRGDPIIPDGAIIDEFQTLTVADAYVTKGAPTQTALRKGKIGLAIVPLTHPSEIYLDEGFDFQLAFNGQPVAGKELTVYRAGGEYEEPKYRKLVKTDQAGKASISFDRPGVYLVMTRHRAEAPKGAETPYRSYTTSLTFEVSR